MLEDLIRILHNKLDTCRSEDEEMIYQDLLKILYKRKGKLEERREAFKEDLQLIIKEEGWDRNPSWKKSPERKRLIEFYEYWTEEDRAKLPKMRCEKEKTWNTKKRLKRWLKNKFD